MKKQILLTAATLVIVIFGISGAAAQDDRKMNDATKMDMSSMKADPVHKLMMGYMSDMSNFATMLRDQALTPDGPDADLARAAVAQLRHDFDAMKEFHQKHMTAMSPEMKAKMKPMMEKMEKRWAMMNEHIVALETAVRSDKPDAKQVAMYANDLVKHLSMKPEMHEGKGDDQKTMKMDM
jgi:hypothetical protein